MMPPLVLGRALRARFGRRRALTRYGAGFVLGCVALLAGSAEAQQDTVEAHAAFTRGREAHRARKVNDAVKEFERAVALDSMSSTYHLWLAHAYSRQISSVNFMRQAFVGRRAGAQYNRAVELAPTSIEAAEGRLEFFLGAPGIVGGGVDKARAEAARIAGFNPYRGKLAEALIAEKQKDLPAAERIYRSVIAEYPDSTRAVDALTFILQNAERFPEAFALVDARLARDSNETGSLYHLGRLASISGQQLPRGEAAMQRYIALIGADSLGQANAHYRLGLIREKQNDRDGARAQYERAVQLYPTHDLAIKALRQLARR
jgi:tetratricopeptide (TPR) repeat protein